MRMLARASSWDPLFWPIVIGAAATIPAGALLERWLPPAIAGGLGMFVAWTGAGVVASFFPPMPHWRLWKWIVASAIGAIVGGGIVFLLERW